MIALVDAIGSVVTLRPADGPWGERIARAVTVAFGGTAAIHEFTELRWITIAGEPGHYPI